MEYLVTAEEMKYYDRETIETYQIPSLVLMERAALGVVEEVEKKAKKSDNILVVCGSGNNGGDGFAIARILLQKGYQTEVLLAGEESRMTKECSLQKTIFSQYGGKRYSKLEKFEYTIVIDAVFGVGLSREITGNLAELIQNLNDLPAYKISVDVPSGISSDTGKIFGTAFKADETITFAFRKLGLILYPGATFAGHVICKEIGIMKQPWKKELPTVFCYEKEDLSLLPKRYPASHKGSYGRVLCIAGSKTMCGAAYFAAKAAYVIGAGMVRIVTAEENRNSLMTNLPEALMTTYSEDTISNDELNTCLGWADVVMIGPGIGTSLLAKNLLHEVLKNAKVPLVIDADAITIAAKYQNWLCSYEHPIVVTPHKKELSRLLGKTIEECNEDLFGVTYQFAKVNQLILAAKDARTIVTDGEERLYLNVSGNSGMATAGSGDVLTGMIAGLLAQGLEAFLAASLGVYIHGLTGDSAKQYKGEYSLIASDLLEHLSNVLNG